MASRVANSEDEPLAVTVASGFAGMRLDQFLSFSLPGESRSQIAHSIRQGLITVDGTCRKTSYRLKEGEELRGRIATPVETTLEPEAVPFPILMEDDHLLLLSKPPGLVVHPGSGNFHGTLVHGLLHHCLEIAGVGDAARPGIVHRLDKDTSGIMLVAKSGFAHRRLVEDFKHRRLHKEYLALVHGRPPAAEGRIVAAIGRHPVHRQKMAVRAEGGRHAASRYQTVTTDLAGNYSLVRVEIETGRTHQIRVHLAHLGCPVAGDTVYASGRDNRLFPRQMLHASRLVFPHPVSGEVIAQQAPLWPDFAEILATLSAGAP
jgi:23S rRNA pseudouridine1911/1915/1917 synthase